MPHSAHGYDVCDFNQLNPELGTEADLERLVAALHEQGMGWCWTLSQITWHRLA